MIKDECKRTAYELLYKIERGRFPSKLRMFFVRLFCPYRIVYLIFNILTLLCLLCLLIVLMLKLCNISIGSYS